MPWSEWKSLSGDLKVETFNVSKGVNVTVTLASVPKKLIILQASNGYGLSIPSDVDIGSNSKPTDYYSYDYEGITGVNHNTFSKNISFTSTRDGTVTVRYI